MQLVIYSLILNHHQAPVADILYEKLGDDFVFVEIENSNETKGDNQSYSDRKYLLQVWKNRFSYEKAFSLALNADMCIFGGNESLPFLSARLKYNKLSFVYGERWLKRGFINIFSPRLLKFSCYYHFFKWSKKKVYKLCASAFASSDDYKLHMFRGKCFKWGYFTYVPTVKHNLFIKKTNCFSFMWCARFIKWKHPELAILLIKRLKENGYNIHLDMYGDGPERASSESLARELNISEYVSFKGNVSNTEVVRSMYEHQIFLFTSDKNEGWGAVVNESMSRGCALVGSDVVGSIPFLIEDGVNGVIFQSCNLKSLEDKVTYLLNNPEALLNIRINGWKTLTELWSPKVAVSNLLQLIDDLSNERESSILVGPCSNA